MEMVTEEVILDADATQYDVSRATALVLPSDHNWRSSNYFRMVEINRSRKNKLEPANGPVERKQELWTVDTLKKVMPYENDQQGLKPNNGDWTTREINLALEALSHQNANKYSTREEQNRVFGLIYEALKFNSIMQKAAEEVEFYVRFPQYDARKEQVGLLIYDLFQRNFQRRNVVKWQLTMADMYAAIWDRRIPLAAALARLRIQNVAFSIDQMLSGPTHCRAGYHNRDLVHGWVNTFKISAKEFERYLSEVWEMELLADTNLPEMAFSADDDVPLFYHCRPNNRAMIINSPLVDQHLFILQDKTLCRGPLVLMKAFDQLSLKGSIGVTHVVTKSTCAYLATIAATNERVDKVFVFGAGNESTSYKTYFKEMSIPNVKVFENRLSKIEDKGDLVGMAAILACPPNCNNRGVDPIFLSITAGGQINTLRDIANNCPPSNRFLDDQRDTLTSALSKPQVQLLVYTTNSINEEENECMVESVTKGINRLVAIKSLKEKIAGDSSLCLPILDFPKKGHTLQVPKCDLFHTIPLPDLHSENKNNYIHSNYNSFYAIIARKDITRFDSKYIIAYAEYRGVLGRNKETKSVKKDSKLTLSHKVALFDESQNESEKKAKKKCNYDRIAASTFASRIRMPGPLLSCGTCSLRSTFNFDKTIRFSLSKIWWKKLLKHIKHYIRYGRSAPRIKLYRPLILLPQRAVSRRHILKINTLYINNPNYY